MATPPAPAFSLELIALLPRLRRYARVLVGSGAGADDLVQDTVERALGRHLQWRPGSDLRAWLFSIMHNRAVDLIRSDRYAPLEEDVETLAFDPGVSDNFEAIDLQRAFDRLEAGHREVLALVAIEQLSYEEAATALNVPVGTVMSRLSRARLRLKAMLELDPADRPAVSTAAGATHLTRIK